MSFRNKLGLAFFSVLVPVMLVSLASWWSMGVALSRQETVFKLSREIEQLFFQINTEEEQFATTQDIGHSRSVSTLLEDLNSRINRLFTYPSEKGPSHASEDEHGQAVKRLQGAFIVYRQGFADFSSQILEMQTIESRMIQESGRLQALSDTLLYNGDPKVLAIQQAKGQMLLGEKDYLLTQRADSIQTVTESVRQIRLLAEDIRLQSIEGTSMPLKVFRIARLAALYEQILRKYIQEKAQAKDTMTRMRASQESFSHELVQYIDHELAIAQANVRNLRLIMVAVSVFVIGLSILATFIISARITRPINQLKKSATDIVNGNLDTVVQIESPDEIGRLGEIFNMMTQRLKISFDDRERYRDHLEDLVAERTEKLEREIVERKQAELALRTSEVRLSLIIEQSPMAIILWDMQLKVVSWNRTAEKIFGYTAGEVIGKPDRMLIAPESRNHVSGIWQKILDDKTVVRSQNENITKDGRVILCDWSNTPLYDAAGSVVGFVSFAEDVTQRSRVEQELLKIKKLESTGVLAGGIAHDFNNILTAILGNLNLSLLDRELSSATRGLLESAEKASKRAKTLTQQLLTFAKGGEPIRESMSLAEVVRDSASFVLHGGNVSCHYDIPEDLWPAHADKGQISQVIQNIVLNARHAMPTGGAIDISCTNVQGDEEQYSLLERNKKFIQIVIRDNGVGISANVLDRIFDPYFTTKQEGSGLGLAITLSIVNKHGGHILVDSEPGKGTVFTLYLPAAEAADELKAEAETGAPAIRSGNVLLMDDDEGVLAVLQAMLEQFGYRVVTSRNGDECAEIYKRLFGTDQAVDFVIVDLTIPGGRGGREVVPLLQEIDPEVKIIVSSGYSNDPVMASFRDYGFCGAVSKPYIVDELLKVIDEAADPHRVKPV